MLFRSTGSRPLTPDEAITDQTLLVTLQFSDPAFPSSSAGSAEAFSIISGIVITSGTATWARIKNGSGSAVFDCTVGTANSFINLQSVNLVINQILPIDYFSLTHPR